MFAQAVGEGVSDPLEHEIALGVAVGVVHRLEVVDVDEQHRARLVPLAETLHRSCDGVDEGAPVGEAGERVGLRLGPHRLELAGVLDGGGALVGEEFEGLHVGTVGQESVLRLVQRDEAHHLA